MSYIKVKLKILPNTPFLFLFLFLFLQVGYVK